MFRRIMFRTGRWIGATSDVVPTAYLEAVLIDAADEHLVFIELTDDDKAVLRAEIERRGPSLTELHEIELQDTKDEFNRPTMDVNPAPLLLAEDMPEARSFPAFVKPQAASILPVTDPLLEPASRPLPEPLRQAPVDQHQHLRTPGSMSADQFGGPADRKIDGLNGAPIEAPAPATAPDSDPDFNADATNPVRVHLTDPTPDTQPQLDPRSNVDLQTAEVNAKMGAAADEPGPDPAPDPDPNHIPTLAKPRTGKRH